MRTGSRRALRAVLDQTILQRFSEMLCTNPVVTGKIGDRSRDTNDAMKGAGGQLQSLSRSFKQLSARLIGTRHAFKFGTGQRRIYARANWPRSLTCARREHSGANGGRGFSDSSLRQLGNRHGLNFNDQVQAISQRP